MKYLLIKEFIMIEVKVTGKNYNYFVKKISNLNIYYYDLYIKENILYFKTDYKSYLKLKAEKGIYNISINKRFKIANTLNELKNNKLLFLTILLFIIYFLFLNLLIFNVEFDTDDSFIKQELNEELKYYNIKLLRIKPTSTKIKKVKKLIANKFKDKIEWLELDVIGNKIIVSYVIKKNKDNNIINPNRSIVAKKNGVIRKIISSKGVIVKNKNEYISKGEEIVTGNIIKDNIIISQVPAEGSVFAEVWYKKTILYPIYEKEKKYIDKIKYNVYINFLSFNKKLYNNYDSDNYKINILKNNIIPLNLYIKKEKKFYYKKKKNTIKKIKTIALNYLDKNFENRLGKKDYIIDKKVLKLSNNGSKIRLDVLYKVYEDITDYKTLDSDMINKKFEDS